MCPTPCTRGLRARSGGRRRPADLRVRSGEPHRHACGDQSRAGKQRVGTRRVQSGFTYVRDFASTTDTHDDGTPVTMSLYVLNLWRFTLGDESGRQKRPQINPTMPDRPGVPVARCQGR